MSRMLASGAARPPMTMKFNFTSKDNWELVVGDGKIAAVRIKE